MENSKIKFSKALKLDKWARNSSSSKHRVYAKKQLARARRRAEKLYLDDAPTSIRHLTRGWVS